MTTEQLRAYLDDPLVLLLVMLAASAGSAWKQIYDGRRNGVAVSCAEYLAHWPETLTMIGGNLLAFLLLVEVDQLNLAAAAGVGYGMNSVADLIRPGGRSAAMSTRPAPEETPTP
jgi:hypothetical protein